VATPSDSAFRISLVDDDRTARQGLATMLAEFGFQIDQFDGAPAFLSALRSIVPDLILLDVEMPMMNGYELCRHLKKNPAWAAIPVLFLSGLSEQKDKLEAFTAGGLDFITKPYAFPEVKARISTHLEIHRLHQELVNQNIHLEELVQEKVKEISESQIATIHALATLVESRDDDTGQHIQRIQHLSRTLASLLRASPQPGYEIDETFVSNVEWASPLHDIGKVGISDAVLLKPGRLTDEEFTLIKQHTVIGAHTLEQVYQLYPHNHFIAMGIEIARSHHERWDGRGYPDGLKGTSIPLSARIVSLADVYDALRSERCYKQALPHEEALAQIVQGAGTQFDPRLAKVFLEHEGELAQVRDRYTN
jgi:putative two-component system response regulator